MPAQTTWPAISDYTSTVDIQIGEVTRYKEEEVTASCAVSTA